MSCCNNKAVTLKVKRGHADTWLELDPILAPGEPGFEIDTHQLKIGDGETPWSELAYINGTTDIDSNCEPIPIVKIEDLFK